MRSTMSRRVRVSAAAGAASLGLIALASSPVQAAPADADNGSSQPRLAASPVPQIADPFAPIAVAEAEVDRAAERAQEESLKARRAERERSAVAERQREEARQRAQERREQASSATRSRARAAHVPVRGRSTITAVFGEQGWHWSGGRHTGLDFAAPSGRNVRAAESGRVVAAGWAGAYGQRVEIRHSGGIVTSYNHLSTILVEVGDEVAGGQHIGDVGATGNVTGSHLHFEVVQRNGRFIDPAAWLGLD